MAGIRNSKQRPFHQAKKKKRYMISIGGSKFQVVEAYSTKEAKEKVWSRIRRRLSPPAIINMVATQLKSS